MPTRSYRPMNDLENLRKRRTRSTSSGNTATATTSWPSGSDGRFRDFDGLTDHAVLDADCALHRCAVASIAEEELGAPRGPSSRRHNRCPPESRPLNCA